ncbi:MAG: hypothetical protein WD403_01820, partial [Pirellulales bacterium]
AVHAFLVQLVSFEAPRAGVKGRLKPASEGRLRTSYFEERTVCRLSSSAGIPWKEDLDGESAQDGDDRSDSEAARLRLVWASYC